MAKRGISRSPGYKAGSHWAICDSCGFQFRAEELKETWDHRWVCDDDFEVRHPQDFLRVKEEKISVDQPIRPEGSTATSSGFSLVAIAGLAVADENVAGDSVPGGTFNMEI